jgi:serpin B
VTKPGYRAIRLPYSERSLAMAIVLPDRVEGPPAVAASLTGAETAKLLSAFESEAPKRVALSMPRFKFGSTLELISTLKLLGVSAAFSDFADFSGMTGQPTGRNGIKISQIRHKAVIEVMEEGTEAAAVTAIVFTRTASMRPKEPEPEPFVVDRPFLFIIADSATGAVLFQGRVANPALEA